MLSKLYIENIAVIERAEIDFSQGFNVLTGETGAGKSILVDSIMAVLGERTSRELVRTGASSAYVSAEFTDIGSAAMQDLAAQGVSPEDGSVILGREIKTDGRGVFRVNGRPVSGSTLRAVGRMLINIHGQHDNQVLLDNSRHLGYIDAIVDDGTLYESYIEAYDEYRAVERELSSLCTDESEKERRIDLLRYQINEIEEAGISVGEVDALRERRNVCMNFERISRSLSEAYAYLGGDDDSMGAVSSVQQASSMMDSISDVFAEIAPLSSRITELSYEIEDIASELCDMLQSMEYDPNEIDEIESRLSVLRRIERKYGGEEEALKFCEDAREELSRIEFSDERREQLIAQREEKLAVAIERAEKLSAARRNAAEKFCELVSSELAYLDMPSVHFVVDISEKPLSGDGADAVEFL
ncbi:MAG: AAA family ATPase, partial [Clostridia bacterium]|nr:AAA family ATPase [Clostridia bacterium]